MHHIVAHYLYAYIPGGVYTGRGVGVAVIWNVTYRYFCAYAVLAYLTPRNLIYRYLQRVYTVYAESEFLRCVHKYSKYIFCIYRGGGVPNGRRMIKNRRIYRLT